MPARMPFQVLVQGYCTPGADVRTDMQSTLGHLSQYFCEKVTDTDGEEM